MNDDALDAVTDRAEKTLGLDEGTLMVDYRHGHVVVPAGQLLALVEKAERLDRVAGEAHIIVFGEDGDCTVCGYPEEHELHPGTTLSELPDDAESLGITALMTGAFLRRLTGHPLSPLDATDVLKVNDLIELCGKIRADLR